MRAAARSLLPGVPAAKEWTGAARLGLRRQDRRDDAGVETAGQEDADGDVGHHALAYGDHQRLAYGVLRLLAGGVVGPDRLVPSERALVQVDVRGQTVLGGVQ